MKHLFIMKTRNIFISALTLLFCIVGVNQIFATRYFEEGEKIYVYVNQSYHDGQFNWTNYGGTYLWMYVFNGESNWWVKLTPDNGDIYAGSMPSGYWDKCIILRRKDDICCNWNDIHNRTCRMSLSDNYSINCINKFWDSNGNTDCDGMAEWRTYAPRPEDISGWVSGMTAEVIKICPDALNSNISLHPKLNGDKSNYLYDDVLCHAWYSSTDGVTWTSVDGYGGNLRDGEQDRDYLTTIPSVLPNNYIYYYLHSTKPSGCRLLKYVVDDDGCGLDCTITSLETAISNVNADDNTFVLDGMVAFGDAEGKNLVVECNGKSKTIDDPKSPQSFSLTDVPANATEADVEKPLNVYFIKSGVKSCERSISITLPKSRNAVMTHDTLHVLTGTTSTLSPTDAELSNKAIWLLGSTEKASQGAGVEKSYTIPTSSVPVIQTYVFKEYYPVTGTQEDLMANGNYTAGKDYGIVDGKSTISDYTYWGQKDNAVEFSEFYTGIHDKATNGFAVVQSSRNFHNAFANILPIEGTHFGLFDATRGIEGGNKKAWFTNTDMSPDLRLEKGKTYVFSFWAANINNYGEMDNAAILQFQIQYKNEKVVPLGTELNLGADEFRNNMWHQCSATFKSDTTAEYITICVMNLNTGELINGNDFALDDIQFHGISSVTQVSKSHQIFPVRFHEPAISAFTATPIQMGCGESTYAVDLNIQYRNQNGKIVVMDITGGGDRLVWDTTLVALPGDGAGATWEEIKVIERRVVQSIVSSDPVGKERTYKVYFESWTSANRSVNFNDPVIPVLTATTTMPSVASCDQQTFDLTVSVKFTNQDGDLQVKVDDGSWKTFYTPSESAGEGKYIKNSAEQTKTVKLTGLPADGGTTHKIYYRFNKDGYCGYDTPLESDNLTFPQSPTITSTSVSATPTAVNCDATNYTRTVTVNYKNAKGKKIVIEDEEGNKLYTSSTALTTSDGSISPSITLPYIDGASHYVIAYFEGYDCKSEPAHKGTYAAPVQPTISEVIVSTVGETKCSPYNYTISGTVTYSNADLPKKLIVAYGALKDEITLSSASATVDFTISDMTAKGSALTVDAYFKDAPDACTKTSNTFASPTQPWMEIKNIRQSTPDCGDLKYNLTFDVDYIYQHGGLSVRVDDYVATVFPIPETNRKKNDKLTVQAAYTSKIPADGKEHTLYVSFDGEKSCSASQTLPAVLSPVITDLSVSVPTDPIACDASSYSADVTVKTQYAVGKTVRVVYKNRNDVDSILGDHVVASTPETYTFSDLPFKDIGATGTRIVRAYLLERDTCVKSAVYSIPPTTSINPFSITKITDRSTCDGVLYDLEGDITYTSKPSDVNPAVRFGTYSAAMTAITATSAHYKFTGLETVGDELAVEAYFTNKPNCFVSSDKFASPLKPNVEVINHVMATPECNAPTTSLKFDIRYTKQPAGTLTVWLDDAPSDKHKEVTYTPNNGSETPTTIENISIADVPADGNEHTLHVQFSNGCSISPTVVTPLSPVIKSVKAHSNDVIIHCNETYSIKVEVECENGGGKKLYVEAIGNDGNPVQKWAYVSASETHPSFTFTDMNLDVYHGPIKAYFEGSTVCDVDKQQADYTLPEIIEISLGTVSVIPVTCGATTFSITGTVTSNRNGQTVVVSTSDGHSTEVTSSTSAATPFTIGGLTASGTVTAQIKDVDCSRTEAKSYEVPAFKPTPTLTLNSIAAQCYPATSFEVTYDHTDADKLYYKVTQGTTKIDWTEVTIDDAKKFTITTTGWAAGDYKVEAYAESAAGCKSATPYPTATLTINKKPSLELAAIADVCEGASGVSTAVTLKDGAAKYDYDVYKNDVLMSDQHKSGQTAASISLSTNTWEPATYKIQVTAYSSADCPSDPKEVSFVINPLPVISELTASQTICEEDDAVSYDFTITGAETYSYSVVGTAIAETDISVPVGGSGTISFNPSALSDGSYTLQVIAKSELGCTTTRNATLKINNKPTVSLTATTNICYLDPAGLDFNYTVSADAYYYDFHIWQADRSQKYGGFGNFTLPTPNEGTIHYDSFSPFGSPLSGGDYLAVMRVRNSAGCMSDSVVVPFTIYPIAGIEIYTVASMCVTKPLSTVFYNIHNANSFRYKIKGVTEWSDPQTPSTEDLKHFEFGISDLAPGNYTLQLQAYNDNCGYSNIAESPFTIYPLPTLDLDVTAAGVNVCHPVAQVDIPYTSTDAKEYTYELTGGGYNKTDTKSASASGKIEVNTDGLPAGDYALSVTAVSDHECEIAAAQTTTIHINPRPTFTFKDAVAQDCYPSTTISVGYTSTDAKTYSYTLTSDETSAVVLSDAGIAASADGIMALNTAGLGAGTYTLAVQPKSENDCEMAVEATMKVIIYPKPTVTVNSIENHCFTDDNEGITVVYTTTDAANYTYKVVGTELTGSGATTGSGSFTINIGGLEADTYTLQLTATSANCTSQTVEKTFDIYPVPAVSVNPLSSIHEGTATFNVPLILTTTATKYDYRFIDKDELTELESNTNVPATQTAITLSTGSLEEGTYMLYVTPKSETCEGVEYPVTVKVANKPTITFSNEEFIVCAETDTLNIPFAISDDAVSFTYHIMQGTTLVAAEQTIDLATHPSSLAVDVKALAYGDYTISGYVKSDLGVQGEIETKGFTILAKPEVVSVTQDKSFIGCGETYSAEIQVNIFNAAGRRIYAKYTDGTEEHNPSQLTDALDESVTFALSGLTDTDHSALHEVKVYVEGFEDCAVTTGYAEPQVMTITSVEVTPLPKSCGDEKFSLTGTVVANCNEGKIVVEYDDTYKAVVDASTSGSDFTILDIPAGGAVTQLKAYFEGKTCGVVNSAVFAEPTMPEASITSTPPASLPCDQATFDLKFTLNYTYQEAGILTVWVDDDHKNTYKSEENKYEVLATSSNQLVDSIIGLPADGRTGQKLYFEFNGSHSCKGSVDLAQFPRTPLITGVEIVAGSIPDLVPGANGTYTPQFTVAYEHTGGETLVLEYQSADGNWHQVSSTTTVTGSGTYTFTGMTFDDVAMSDRKVRVHFKGDEFQNCVHEQAYTTPSNSSVKFVSAELINTSTCDHLRYDLKGFVTFLGEPLGDLVVEFADSVFVITNADCIGKANTNLPFEIKNVELDIPAAGMQLVTYFTGIPEHKSTFDEVFNNPVIPHIEIANASYSTPECNSTKTTLTFDLTYLKQQGNLHVAVDGVEQTYSLSEALSLNDETTKTVTVTVADQLANGLAGQLRVWFDGANSCDLSDNLPQAPFGPQISDIQDPVISDEFCDVDNYTVTVSFTVTNGQGKNVTVSSKGVTVTPVAVEGVNTVVLAGVPRNDEAGTVDIYFADASNTDCEHLTATYTQRPKPELSAEMTVDTLFTCADKTYTVQLSITQENQTGACTIIDSIAGGATRSFTDVSSFTIGRPAASEAHYVIVRYPATGCEVVSEPIDINPYTKPEPQISLKTIDRLCDTEAELNLSFALTQGDIVEAAITLTDSKGNPVLTNAALAINDSKDTLSYILTEQLAAGKYTAVVEVQDTLDCVTSASLPIEVAQDGMIYRKWTDVLIVDNSSGLYTAYQWYENGEPLQNMSEQVLYMPDGAEGTYYCLLTLTDGTQIYTCEHAFREFTRSADKPRESTNHIVVSPSRVIQGGVVNVHQSELENLQLVLMSSTGQHLAEYTQTESNQSIMMPSVQGMYLLLIESPNELKTEKIVVY